MANKVQTETPKKRIKRTYVALDALPQTGMVRLPTILKFTGISKAAFYLGIKQGRFPKPLHNLGPRTSCWKAEDIRKLIEETK